MEREIIASLEYEARRFASREAIQSRMNERYIHAADPCFPAFWIKSMYRTGVSTFLYPIFYDIRER